MSNPPIPKINFQNEIIGETTIGEAVKNKWPRRVVRIFVFDTEGKILMQKRSSTIIGYPNHWDQAAGGHVDVGEEPGESAWREAKEEIGLDLELNQLLEAYYTEVGETPVFNYVYRAIIPVATEIVFDKTEVAEVRWLRIEELEEKLTDKAWKFIPGFIDIWNNFRDKLIAS